MLLFNYNEVGKVAKYHLLASAGEKIILVLKLYTAEDHFYVAKCNLGKVLLLLVSVNLLYRLDCSKVVAFPMLALTIPVGGESNFGLSV